MGEGLIRFSVGLDNDIERTWTVINCCLCELGIVDRIHANARSLEDVSSEDLAILSL